MYVWFEKMFMASSVNRLSTLSDLESLRLESIRPGEDRQEKFWELEEHSRF